MRLLGNKIGLAAVFSILISLIYVMEIFAADDIKVRAELNTPTALEGDEITYTVTVEGSDLSDDIKPKVAGINAEGIELLGVNTSRSMISGSSMTIVINGQVVRDEKSGSEITAFEHYLHAAKPGTYRIGPAVVKVRGVDYSSDTVVLKVTALPKAGGKVTPVTDVFVNAEPSSEKLYVGQLLTVSYFLYVHEDVKIKRLDPNIDLPELGGFIRYDFERPRSHPTSKVTLEGGNRYLRAYLGRLIVFPTRHGTLTIGPVKQGYSRVVIVNPNRVFQQYRLVESRAPSPPVIVEVMPLPKRDRPARFSGAVGRFNVGANIDRVNIRAGENITMTVKITGTGNLEGAAEPIITLPSSVESYPPEKEDNTSMQDNDLRWERTYRYILVPHSEKATIGPAKFSYFDPKSAKFITSTSRAFTVKVSPGPKGASVPGKVEEEKPKLVKDIRYIKPDVQSLRDRDPLIYRRSWFLAVHLFPLMVLGAAVLWRKRRDRLESDTAYARKRGSLENAGKRLESARKVMASSTDDFHREIYMAITGYIADIFNLPDVGLPPGDFVDRLVSAGVDREDIDRVVKLLEKCQAARYLPGEEETDGKQLLKEASDVLKLLRKALKETQQK